MQTLHALYMLVVLQILANLYGKLYVYDKDGKLIEALTEALTEGQISIVTIILTTGLVKLEKLFKSMFNIGDSFAGDLKAGTQSMMKAMGAVKGIAAGAKAVGDNAGKYKDASRRRQAAGLKMAELKRKMGSAAANTTNVSNTTTTVNSNTQTSTNSNVNTNTITGANANNISNNNTNDYLRQIIDALKNPTPITLEQQYQQAEAEYAKASADMKSARFAEIMGPANLAAGLGIGLGMGEDISESLFKGGYITAALDKGAETIGHMSADKDRKTFYDYEKREGQKYGYTPSEKIIREKTTVEKTIEKVKENPRLAVDPIAVGKEIGKQFQGVGNVLSNTMAKELRQIDRSLDDSQ